MQLTALLAHDPDVRALHSGGLNQVAQLGLIEELGTGGLSFVKNSKFLEKLTRRQTQGPLTESGVIFEQKLWDKLPADQQQGWLECLGFVGVTANVPLAMARLSKPMHQEVFAGLQSAVDGRQLGTTDIDPTTIIAQGVFVGERVKIGARVRIHPGVVVYSQVEIGDDTEIFANTVIYPRTKIGRRVRIHGNTTIGADGFGYVFHQGQHQKIWHMGGVTIHDDVEIGANSSIDMGAFTATVIGAGTRIDNHVQIGHNVKIGRGCVLCGKVGVSGSAVLEDFVVVGGAAGIGPDVHIGMASQVAGAAMVNEGAVWPAKSVIAGHPARDIKEWMRTFAWVRKNALKD